MIQRDTVTDRQVNRQTMSDGRIVANSNRQADSNRRLNSGSQIYGRMMTDIVTKKKS